jgi:hypothetical protein
VLVHPITGLWLVGALLAVAVSRVRDVRGWIWVAGAGGLGLVVTLAWPYFRVFDLLHETNADVANQKMYESVLLRVLPAAVLGLWAIWRRVRLDRRDPLALMLVGGLAIYAYGFLRGEDTYGRALALVVIVLDVAAGDGVARLEKTFRWRRSSAWVRAGTVALGALILFGLITTRGGLVRMVPTAFLPTSVRTSDELERVDDRYSFLSRLVGSNDVVIGTTNEDNRVIPAIAGQPLRPFWGAPAPRDAAARAAAQAEFLDPATTSDRRGAIQTRYKVRFVLLHPGDPGTTSLARTLESGGGKVVYDNDGFQLVVLPFR